MVKKTPPADTAPAEGLLTPPPDTDLWNAIANWQPDVNSFLIFGLILLAGVIGGALAQKGKYTPRITGFIVAGFIIGPNVLGLLDAEMLARARFLVDIALGIIVFKIASLIKPADIFRRRRMLYTTLAEAGLTFAAIYAGLSYMGMAGHPAALVAAIGVSSSPAVLLLVTRELRASGKLTYYATNLVALNNLTSFLIYLVVMLSVQAQIETSAGGIMLLLVYQFAGAAVLALGLARVAGLISRLLVREDDFTHLFPIFIGTIVLGLGIAQLFSVSALFLLFCLGLFSFNERSYDTDEKRNHLIDTLFDHGYIFYIILFSLAGASLHVDALADYGILALVFIGCRAAGKLLAFVLNKHLLQLTLPQTGYLGMMTLPMAGLAIGLAQTTEHLMPGISGAVSAIVFAAVAILETVGPIATEIALKKSGELPQGQTVSH